MHLEKLSICTSIIDKQTRALSREFNNTNSIQRVVNSSTIKELNIGNAELSGECFVAMMDCLETNKVLESLEFYMPPVELLLGENGCPV